MTSTETGKMHALAQTAITIVVKKTNKYIYVMSDSVINRIETNLSACSSHKFKSWWVCHILSM